MPTIIAAVRRIFSTSAGPGDDAPRRRPPRATAILISLSLVGFVGHMLVASNYGYFRDELYFIEAGHHLSFGYVDFPPLVAALAALLNLTAGDALWAIHVVPALASSLIVLFTGLMARELGGARFAQALAATASLVAATFLATGSIFSMDSLDALWWTVAAYVLVRLLQEDRPRLWLLFGLVAGVGLTTKLTMLSFGLALTIGLLLTPARRYFLGGRIWLGAAISFAFLLPYALWNLANGWPTLEFGANYGGSEDGPIGFLSGQILGMNPLTLPLSLAGLWFYFGTRYGRRCRALGWAFVVLLILFTLTGAKSYFLSPAYPALFAGGAVLAGRLGGRIWGTLKPAYLSLLLASGLLLAPLTMPVLPPEIFAKTYGAMSGAGNASAGQENQGVFPQYLGDRFGWNSMTRTVASAYDDLPAKERSQACVFTSNYGEASALNFLGKKHGLPPAISGHNSYYLWGPGGCKGKTMITVGVRRDDVRSLYTKVTLSGTTRCLYCESEENGGPIYVASKPRAPLSAVWPQAKHYD